MRDMHALVAVICPVCRLKFRVDLEAIIQLRGRFYSLIDQRGPCRQYDCSGKAFFIFSPGNGVPFRPLSTDAGEWARILSDGAEEVPPDDDSPPLSTRPPRPPRGINPGAWASADERERKRLIRSARG